MAEKEQNHQAFVEELSAALKASPLEDHWALIFPLQLLAGSISLVPLPEIPATTQPQAAADIGFVPAPFTLDTPAPTPGIKWHWLSSGHGMPNPEQ